MDLLGIIGYEQERDGRMPSMLLNATERAYNLERVDSYLPSTFLHNARKATANELVHTYGCTYLLE